MCNIGIYSTTIRNSKAIRLRKNSLGLQWWKSGLPLSLCWIYVLTRGIKVLYWVNRGRKERFRASFVAYIDQNKIPWFLDWSTIRSTWRRWKNVPNWSLRKIGTIQRCTKFFQEWLLSSWNRKLHCHSFLCRIEWDKKIDLLVAGSVRWLLQPSQDVVRKSCERKYFKIIW